ncbi:MAG TPA: transcriptional regulator [Gammaproteobacteria bacterium]|nr:transcriptional regulator [Gammaproteobacteria bacterium]
MIRASVKVKVNDVFAQATKHWKYVAPILTYPKNETAYHLLVKRLDQLLDIVGENEKHPLIGLVDVLSNLIAAYEDSHVQSSNRNQGMSALKYLIELHHLNQADLPEIGSQGVVSEVLRGKRKLNLRQLQLLAKRFNVSVSTFLDEDTESNA